MENINTQNTETVSEATNKFLSSCRRASIGGTVIGTGLALGAEYLSRNSSKGSMIVAGVVGIFSGIGTYSMVKQMDDVDTSGFSNEELKVISRNLFATALGSAALGGFSVSRLVASYKKLESGQVASSDNDVLELE